MKNQQMVSYQKASALQRKQWRDNNIENVEKFLIATPQGLISKMYNEQKIRKIKDPIKNE